MTRPPYLIVAFLALYLTGAVIDIYRVLRGTLNVWSTFSLDLCVSLCSVPLWWAFLWQAYKEQKK